MSEPATLVTYGEAATAFGVNPNTIGDLAKRLGIQPKPVPVASKAEFSSAMGDLKGLKPLPPSIPQEKAAPQRVIIGIELAVLDEAAPAGPDSGGEEP